MMHADTKKRKQCNSIEIRNTDTSIKINKYINENVYIIILFIQSISIVNEIKSSQKIQASKYSCGKLPMTCQYKKMYIFRLFCEAFIWASVLAMVISIFRQKYFSKCQFVILINLQCLTLFQIYFSVLH